MTVHRPPNDDDELRPGSHLSFDWRLNLSHLIATASLTIGLFAWANSMDKRVSVLEEKAQTQRERDAQQDSQLSGSLLLLRADLAGMRQESAETNRKLDRLIESLSRRPQ